MSNRKKIPPSQVRRRRILDSDGGSSSAGVVVVHQHACQVCTHPFSTSGGNLWNKSEKLVAMLQNLCIQIGINYRSIPGVFFSAGSTYPMCDDCFRKMKQLWDFQLQRQQIDSGVAAVVSGLQKKVADSEILKGGSFQRAPSFSARSSFPLKDLILEGYRNKLQTSLPVPMYHRQQSRIKVSKVAPPPLLAIAAGPHHHDYYNLPEDWDNGDEIIEIFPLHHSPSSGSFGVGSLRNETEEQGYSNEENSISQEHHHHNVDEFLAINLPNQSVFYLNHPSVAGDQDEELLVGSNHDDNENSQSQMEENDDDSEESEEDGDIFVVESQDKKFVFEGVEIYTCTGSKSSVKYLQCGRCSYMLPFSNCGRTGKTSAVVQMKRHINSTHKAVPVKKRKRGCHSSSPMPAPLQESSQSCDICGRIVRGNPLALLSHKFTHKNDEERASALAAGEPGSRACFLSKKPRCGKRMKKLMNNKKPSTPQESDWKGNLTCLFCLRTFERKNYLKLHLKTHKDQVKPRKRKGAPTPNPKFKKGSQDEFCWALGLARNVKKGSGEGRGNSAGTSKGFHSR